jgi:glucose/arabinose dehydrogenase
MNYRSIRGAAFFLLFSLASLLSFAQVNETIANATTITPAASCGGLSGQTLYRANSEGTTSTCNTTTLDVWYKFTTPANVTAVTITLPAADRGNNVTSSATYIEAYDARTAGTVSTATTLGCADITNGLSLSGLQQNTLYFFRVFTRNTNNTNNSTSWGFSVCVSYSLPLTNDDCSTATALTVGTPAAGTVWVATASSGIPAGCISGNPDDDVWFKFTAATTSASISLSSVGTELTNSGANIQVLSGACGSLTSVACGTNSVVALGLTAGSEYYVRVYSAGTSSIGGTASGSTFNITVANPPALTQSSVTPGTMKEVFQETTIIPAASGLNNPWEIAYGTDGHLWVTESRGYKVYRIDPNTGLKITVLDISQNSTFLPLAERTFNLQFNFGTMGNPQGGLAGMAIHPDFNAATPKRYVYISYIHKYVTTAAGGGGKFFTNQLVRFTYNPTTSRLENPVALHDALPGSSDHNSQRMIIAPVNGVNYLFYASGDMGSGQYDNLTRPLNAQDASSYEGKILRFNLEEDGDAGALDKWVPNDNPFGSSNAVWSTGMRNNQGFAYAKINGTDYLYGSSHGPFSDDEVNIIEKGKNYGHPIVIGYSTDGNYDGAAAGPSNGSCPPIASEAANAAGLGSSYRDPILSFYAAPKGNTTTPWSIQYIYTNQSNALNSNGSWDSDGISGMDIYTGTAIPGWKNSLLLGTLKGGKTLRLKLNNSGSEIVGANNIKTKTDADGLAYFRSVNRFRDIAIASDGKSIFTIIDKSQVTSGPTAGSPVVSACAGCILKYTFLGYADASGKSSIPATIDITTASAVNTVVPGTEITINSTNNNLWVPITGPDGNILAEIKANGNNLGTVISSFYLSGSSREDAQKKLYLNRSITITPQNQPATPVSVRLYVTNDELNTLKNATNTQNLPSQVTTISDVRIRKNNDNAPIALTAATTTINPVYAEAHGSNGYVLQADINSFSTFYFGNPDMTTLPLMLVEFKGSLKNNASLLQWKTEHERNTHHFVVERSADGRSFKEIGSVNATGSGEMSYNYTDYDAAAQASSIVYYRLRMVDIDEAFSYSKVISISYPSSNEAIVYPNPIHNELNLRVSLTTADHIRIQITDMQGRAVYNEARQASAGTTEIKINTKKWPSQTYSVIIKGSDNKVMLNRKVVKL